VGYLTGLVRRKSIPKGQGKVRPRGLPTLEDKLVPRAAGQILPAISEADFLPCRSGYRPRSGLLRVEATRNPF